MYSWESLLGTKSEVTQDPLNRVRKQMCPTHKIHLFRRLELCVGVSSLVAISVFETGKKSVIAIVFYQK